MHNRDIVICFFLDFLKAGFYSPSVSFIRKSLLCVLLFERRCHFALENLLILGFKPVYRILTFSGFIFNADLTARFVFSLYVLICENKTYEIASAFYGSRLFPSWSV